MEISVDAWNPQPTTAGVERGVDVDVNVTLPDGREVSGEVTLLPAEDGRPVYQAWGEPSNWVEGRLLNELLDAAGGDAEALRLMLADVEFATSTVAGRP